LKKIKEERVEVRAKTIKFFHAETLEQRVRNGSDPEYLLLISNFLTM